MEPNIVLFGPFVSCTLDNKQFSDAHGWRRIQKMAQFDVALKNTSLPLMLCHYTYNKHCSTKCKAQQKLLGCVSSTIHTHDMLTLAPRWKDDVSCTAQMDLYPKGTKGTDTRKAWCWAPEMESTSSRIMSTSTTFLISIIIVVCDRERAEFSEFDLQGKGLKKMDWDLSFDVSYLLFRLHFC